MGARQGQQVAAKAPGGQRTVQGCRRVGVRRRHRGARVHLGQAAEHGGVRSRHGGVVVGVAEVVQQGVRLGRARAAGGHAVRQTQAAVVRAGAVPDDARVDGGIGNWLLKEGNEVAR